MANQFRVRKGLIVNGSGSTLLDVQGSQGQLFSITDSLSGSLFAAKDISGIPVIEAFSDNRVNIGTFNAEAIKVSGSFAFVTGSLYGTASFSRNSSTASYVDASNVVGLNISRIASASATASIQPGLFSVNTDTQITGSLIVTEGITGSISTNSTIGNNPVVDLYTAIALSVAL